MSFNNKSFVIIFFIAILFIPTHQAYAQSHQQTLNQYIADLQKNPNDYALREKIIKHVQGMRPAPAVPEEARRYFVKAVTIQKEAKNIKGFELAANAYSHALIIAPWWADAYYNRGLALESSNQYDEAVKALKFYLLTNPGTSESRAAQDKIYALEAKMEMAQVKETTPVEKPKADLDVSGRWRETEGPCRDFLYHIEFRLDGDRLYSELVYLEEYARANEGCPQANTYRGRRLPWHTFIRIGKTEFRFSDEFDVKKIEFIGNKAFLTWIDRGTPGRGGILIRER
jgi:tetratricopeptide (TPR) repeat protein